MKLKLSTIFFALYLLVPSIATATNYHKIIVSGKMHTLPNPLIYSYSTRDYYYKYIIDIDKKEGSYWVSSGSKWQQLSRFTILLIVDEREQFKGEPVFNLYFAPRSPLNKLQISKSWNKLAGPTNDWFQIEPQ